jgi:hypothetical protein
MSLKTVCATLRQIYFYPFSGLWRQFTGGQSARTHISPRGFAYGDLSLCVQFRDSERTEIIPQINLQINLASNGPYKRLPWT